MYIKCINLENIIIFYKMYGKRKCKNLFENKDKFWCHGSLVTTSLQNWGGRYQCNIKSHSLKIDRVMVKTTKKQTVYKTQVEPNTKQLEIHQKREWMISNSSDGNKIIFQIIHRCNARVSTNLVISLIRLFKFEKKMTGFVYKNWNASVVICVTDILKRSTNSW